MQMTAKYKDVKLPAFPGKRFFKNQESVVQGRKVDL